MIKKLIKMSLRKFVFNRIYELIFYLNLFV